jgi:hypothetical protein
MLKLSATFLVLLVLSCVGLAQSPDQGKTSIIWSPDPTCHQNNSAQVKALKPVCSSVQVENMAFRIIEFGGVLYAMTHRPVRDYLVASVQITNNAASPIEVIAKRSRLGRFKSVEDYAANARINYANAQSQDDLRKVEYRESEVLGERDGEIRSGLKLMERYEQNKERGKVIQRTNRSEPAAPQTEREAETSITREILVPRAIFDYVLKSKTLATGEKAAGHLVFKNSDEEKAYLVLYLSAGQFEFVFPPVPN